MRHVFWVVLLLVSYHLEAQSTVIIHGTVTDAPTNSPVANAPVYIESDSSVVSYFNTVYTDANGQYADTILNFSPTQVTFYLQTPSCNSTMQYATANYVQGNPASTLVNIAICQGGIAGSCTAAYSWQVIGNNQVQFFSTSVGSNPNATLTYLWSFGGGAITSTLQNPIITFPGSGIYMNYLTITDNTGCTNTTADSLWVGNCQANFGVQISGNYVYLANLSQSANNIYTSTWHINGQTLVAQDTVWQAPSPGTYNVCLVIEDAIAQCVDTFCQTVNVVATNTYDLHGNVYADSTNAAGGDTIIVYLIEHDTVAATLTAIDSTYSSLNSSGIGAYTFSGIPSGNYLVKAAVYSPASPIYPDFIPSYYSYFLGGALFWSAATSIEIPSLNPAFPPSYNYDIHLQQGINPGGPGFIGGLISQGANKTVGDPMVNKEVILLNMNDIPVNYTFSDQNGAFHFSNLEYGTYKVYTEIFGLPTIPTIVHIDANTPMATDLGIQINSTGVTSIWDNALIQSISAVSPNPVKEEANITVKINEKAVVCTEIVNLIGQIVGSQSESCGAGTQEISIQTAHLVKGIYFVRILANGNLQKVAKFVKE